MKKKYMHEICQNKTKRIMHRPQPIIIVGINPEQNHKNQTSLESASSKCPSLEYRTFLKTMYQYDRYNVYVRMCASIVYVLGKRKEETILS